MCGFAGLLASSPIAENVLRTAADILSHRGPDDSGLWRSEDQLVGLSHRRLAIIDLSGAGHQPMVSGCGRYVIAYNGEIYNFRAVKDALRSEGRQLVFKGHSDTEVLLAAIAAWGVEATLAKIDGMFAFALWDTAKRQLWLARDRFGEKPLYYGWTRAGFCFASELKAITSLPGFDNAIDPAALRAMLGRGYVPEPLSIYRRIFKLMPGTALAIDQEAALQVRDTPPEQGSDRGIRHVCFYDYAQVVAAGSSKPFDEYEVAKGAVAQSLAKAVSDQLVADVGVGTFLSGGIDSSLITAFAARASMQPLKTFTIGFEDAAFNEAIYASKVAAHFGTDHHELYVTSDDAREVIPSLATMYDEPFADSSQLPTYLVSRLARGHVTVSLSGDGGDELFGGYNRHRYFPKLWRALSPVPLPVRRVGEKAIGPLAQVAWTNVARLRGRQRPVQSGRRVRTALSIFSRAQNFDQMIDLFLDHWSLWPDPVKVPYKPFEASRSEHYGQMAERPLETRMMYADAVRYLPGDVLCKVDRAAMAVSLETRVPFLNPNVASVAARIPLSMKFDAAGGKRILRGILSDMLPRELVERPKAGFAIPVGEWIKGPLRDWCEELLSVTALERSGLLDPAPIRRRFEDHLAGRDDATEALWPVLMFQQWYSERYS